jgi:hypothetical protein
VFHFGFKFEFSHQLQPKVYLSSVKLPMITADLDSVICVVIFRMISFGKCNDLYGIIND